MTKRRGLIIAVITILLAWGSLGTVLGVQDSQSDDFGPKLGLDLKGGFEIRLKAPDGTDSDVLEKAADIIRRRIEALGNVQEPEVAVTKDGAIKVQLPGVTDRERALGAVGSTGQLSFRCVIDRGVQPFVSPLFREYGIPIPGSVEDPPELPPTAPAVGNCPLPAEPWIAPDTFPEGVDPTSGITIVDDPEREAWLIEETSGTIYHVGPAAILGTDISGGDALFSGAGGLGAGEWVVDPSFTSEGERAFEQTTKDLALFVPGDPRRQFAIVLDGLVVSAPQINPGVSAEEGLDAGNAIITVGAGDNPQAEAEDLATVLQYGALPVTFETDKERAVSASLGSDSLRAGLLAGFGGLALVGLAMMAYYRALGLITLIGLTVFGSILLMAFTLLGEIQGLTLTLAGVTGLIVSVGITSDSYIVYFERVKEEVRHGRSLRAAVDGAFGRAFRTILTADFVSLMGATVLYLLTEAQVRGFATALAMATVADVIVAYYFTRPAAAFLVRTRLGDGGALSVRGAVGHPAGAKS